MSRRRANDPMHFYHHHRAGGLLLMAAGVCLSAAGLCLSAACEPDNNKTTGGSSEPRTQAPRRKAPRPKTPRRGAPSNLLPIPQDLLADPQRFSFLVFGDSRGERCLCDPPRKHRRRCPTVTRRAAGSAGATVCERAPELIFGEVGRRLGAGAGQRGGAAPAREDQFALFTGDLVYRGSCAKDWDVASRRLLSRVPVSRLFPILGNHDLWHGRGEPLPLPFYFQAFGHLRFREANREAKRTRQATDYTFMVGPSLFVNLDSGAYPRFGSRQDNRRANTLWNSPRASYAVQMLRLTRALRWSLGRGLKHVFVQYHKPSFSCTRHAPLGPANDPLRVLRPFKARHPKVNVVVLNGHNHGTAWFWDQGGLLRVAAAGGAPLYGVGRAGTCHPKPGQPPEKFWGKRRRTLRYNFFRFAVDGSRLAIQEHCLARPDGKVRFERGAVIAPDGRVTHPAGACKL